MLRADEGIIVHCQQPKVEENSSLVFAVWQKKGKKVRNGPPGERKNLRELNLG